MPTPRLTDSELAAVRTGYGDWEVTPDLMRRRIEFADFPTAIRFVDLIAPVAEDRQHHPDLTINWRSVTVELTTHDSGGLTALDLDLATEVDRIVGDLPLA